MRVERQDLTSAPNTVTVAKAKKHLRITHAEHDDYLKALLFAAEDHISEITGVMLRRHRLRIFFDPITVFTVPYIPVYGLEKVGYYPDDGSAFVEMTATEYVILRYGNQLRIAFNTIPAIHENGMRVDVLAGYPSAINDEKVKLGVKLLVAHLYHNMLPAGDVRLWNVPWSLSFFLSSLRYTQLSEITNASSS
jgi:uncharacterized phiE125 gp8 family phage protein